MSAADDTPLGPPAGPPSWPPPVASPMAPPAPMRATTPRWVMPTLAAVLLVAGGAVGAVVLTGDKQPAPGASAPPSIIASSSGSASPDATVSTSPPASPDISSPPSPTASALFGLTQSCTNDRDGYSLSYPAGWYTVDDLPAWRCALFDPYPITIPAFSELPPTAVLVYIDRNRYRDVVEALTDPTFFRVIDLTGGTFTDRALSGVAITVRQTEALLYDRGTRFFYVIIDLGDRTFVAQTSSLANGGFGANADTVFAMAQALRLTP